MLGNPRSGLTGRLRTRRLSSTRTQKATRVVAQNTDPVQAMAATTDTSSPRMVFGPQARVCLACGGSLAPCGKKAANGNTYTYSLCQDCGFVFVNPRPVQASLARFYQRLPSSNGVAPAAHVRGAARLVARMLRLGPPGRRFLDIGIVFCFLPNTFTHCQHVGSLPQAEFGWQLGCTWGLTLTLPSEASVSPSVCAGRFGVFVVHRLPPAGAGPDHSLTWNLPAHCRPLGRDLESHT